MKHLKKLFAFAVVMVLMSCGNGKNTSSTTASRTESTTDRDYNSNTDRMDNTSSTDRMTNTNTYEPTDYDRTRMTNLYSHLNLSEDQVAQYENASRQQMDTWRRNNPNSTLNTQQRMKLEDQSMKSFLDSNQYSSYQQWVRDNPYKY